jgi:hypothetical protein
MERRPDRATYEEAVACSPTEQAFRRTLWELLVELRTTLPADLREALRDHLTRKDAQGFSLCFNSPTREKFMVELETWLTTHEPRLYLRVAATLFPVPHA